MLKTSKKILSIIMVVIMVLTAVPLSGFLGLELPAFDLGIRASALAESGQCGENVYWSYDSATGELVISGTGPMWDYEFTYTNHWQEYVNSPFYMNNSIKTVIINDGVASIGDYAFYNCDGIIDVTIADSVVSAGEASFHYCDGIIYIDIGNGITALDAFFYDDGEGYSKPENLKTIKIGSGVKSIPSYCFSYLTKLENVYLSEGLEKIGDYAFSGCTYLENINIPNSVTYIGEDILHNTAWFNYKEQGLLTLDGWIYGFKGDVGSNIRVAIASGIKSITDGAFKDIDIVSYDVDTNNMFFSSKEGVLFNKDKTEIILYPIGKDDYSYTIPNGVTTIGDYAFSNCKTLGNITISDSVTTIGVGAFYQCSGLKAIKIPNSVTTIKNRAFYNCGLRKIEFGKNIKSIENYAFLGSNSASVFISDLAAWCKIDFYGYYYDDLEHIIPYSNPLSGGGSLYVDGKKAVNLIIPETITEIKSATFYGCSSIETVIIPDCVTKITGGAFAECKNLKAIEIGNSVSAIGDEAFRRCNSLINVTFGAAIKSIKSNAFYRCDNIKNIYYPSSQKEWETVSGRSQLSNANLFLMHTHEYTETVIKQVTCEEDGEILYTCKLGDIKREIIPALGHNWVDMGGSVKSTCTTEGVDNYKCSNCGKEKKGTTPAMDHNWEYIEITYATCDKDGYMLRACQREGCNAKEEKVTPATHDLEVWNEKSPTCTESGKKSVSCMDCSYSSVVVLPAKGHTYSEWVELLPATCSERGLNIKICNDCNDIQRQIIPKLAHIDADGNGVCDTCENTDTPDVPDTPDEPDTPNEPDVPEDPSANCSCNCHKSGLSNIIFNIILFFQKLLRSNKTCSCGASHY